MHVVVSSLTREPIQSSSAGYSVAFEKEKLPGNGHAVDVYKVFISIEYTPYLAPSSVTSQNKSLCHAGVTGFT